MNIRSGTPMCDSPGGKFFFSSPKTLPETVWTEMSRATLELRLSLPAPLPGFCQGTSEQLQEDPVKNVNSSQMCANQHVQSFTASRLDTCFGKVAVELTKVPVFICCNHR